jgi:hypothetical protein
MISEQDIIDALVPVKKIRGIESELNHVRNVFLSSYPNDK